MTKISAVLLLLAVMLSIMTEFSVLSFIPKLEPKKVTSFSALSLFPPNGGSDERGGFGSGSVGRGFGGYRGRGGYGGGRGGGFGAGRSTGRGTAAPGTNTATGNEPVRRLDVNPGGSTAGSSSSIVSPTHIVAPAPKKP